MDSLSRTPFGPLSFRLDKSGKHKNGKHGFALAWTTLEDASGLQNLCSGAFESWTPLFKLDELCVDTQ